MKAVLPTYACDCSFKGVPMANGFTIDYLILDQLLSCKTKFNTLLHHWNTAPSEASQLTANQIFTAATQTTLLNNKVISNNYFKLDL